MSKKLLKSIFSFSSMTMVSRITGFLRDLMFARIFGASAEFDAFLVAFRIPNFLRNLFAEGAFSQAFIPVLSEYREQRGEDETKIFLRRMAGTLIVALFVITAIAIVITPMIVWILAPGFAHDPTPLRYELTKNMLRIIFPYLFFISLTAFASGILNTHGKFAIPAFTPNLLNFALIGAAIFMAPHFKHPVEALAWGVLIGGIAQILFQLPFLWRLDLLPWPEFKQFWMDAGVRRILKLMTPAIFGVSVAQISLLVDMFFASFLRAGSITWLNYSSRFTYFPIGVFGVAIATVVLPHLSRKYATKSTSEFSAALDWGLRFVLMIAIPAAIILMMLGGPILAALIQYGQFTSFDAQMTQRSLIAFSFGVPAFMLVKVLASGFYSQQNIATPVKIAVGAVVANIVFNVILIYPLAHAGLALATALSSSLNAWFLTYFLLKKKIYLPDKQWKKFGWRILVASGLMILFLGMFTAQLPQWFSWNWFNRVWHLALLCAGAIAVYIGSLLMTGMRGKDFLIQSQQH